MFCRGQYICCMKWLCFIFCVVVLSSCEKSVSFDLEDSPPKLVVEATIENGEAPRVVLTKSLNYFSEITPQMLAGSFVRNAVVTVSNGTLTHTLKEYAVPLPGGLSLYYYSNDTSIGSNAFTGTLNTKYTLSITTEGTNYTASTTIPNITKRIDSVWWKPSPRNVDSNKVLVNLRLTDPKGYGDYGRYFTQRNRQPMYPGINSVFDDLFIDGTTYEVIVDPGYDRNVRVESDNNFFARGDTVTLKLSNIDKATYDFWRTMEFSYASIGNPFSTPIKILNNVSNGALGYFGGYASLYRTIIIPK